MRWSLPVFGFCDGPKGREKSPAKPARRIKPARSAGQKHATMLVIASLLALPLGACPASDVVLGNEHITDGARMCCHDRPFNTENCYSGPDLCHVSDLTHQCCFLDPIVACHSNTNIPREACPTNVSNIQWCEPPAPPPEEPGLSPGATAGIVVGGILGPFALGLAYKSLMYK